MTVFADKKDYFHDEIFPLIVEVTWKGNPSDFQVRLKEHPETEGLDILGTGASGQVLRDATNQIQKKSIRINVRSNKIGTVFVKPITVIATHVASGEIIQLHSEPLQILIIKRIEPWKPSTQLLIFIAFAIVLSLVLFVFIQKRAQKKQIELMKLHSETHRYYEHQILESLRLIKSDPENEITNHSKILHCLNQLLKNADSMEILSKLGKEKQTAWVEIKEKFDFYRFSGTKMDYLTIDLLKNSLEHILKTMIEYKKTMEKA